MKTRVSVIIPIYNVQEFLEECIDSVVNQTINDMELNEFERNLQVILVDDGSTDDSAIIAKRYADEYDFVEYVYEENQGLGHARNYGCEFAQGDYIIFLDSDDKVDLKAYERMYKLAVKNNSDMAIGQVLHFNSRITWRSKIHDIAFSGSKEVTHISDSHELIYDTTAWNKLIKREFWQRHQFKFPEGILYEDIPVTVPMHVLANNVSLVFENCYLWRVREGKSSSITQSTTEFKNLTDRLLVLDMVDDFFEKNVSDENLILAKDVKWLKHDILIFINILKNVLKKDSAEFMGIITDYVNKMDLDNLMKYLNEIQYLKYEFLLKGDYDRLVDLLYFESEDLPKSNIRLEDSHLVVDCNGEFSDEGYLIIDDYVKDKLVSYYLQKVSFKRKFLEIRGFTFVPGLKIENFEDCEYSFHLINEDNNMKVPLEYERVKTGDLSSYNLPFNNSVPYDAAGYKLKLHYDDLKDNNDFIGENRILVTFKQENIEYNYFAGVIRNKDKNKSNLKAIMRGDNYFCTKYDLHNELILDIRPVRHRFEEIKIENNRLCIPSPENYGEVFAFYEEDALNDEFRIPLIYDENNKLYSVELKDLPYLPCKLKYENDEDLVHKWKRFMIFHSDEGQYIVNTLNDYYYNIEKQDNITKIIEISKQGTTIFIKSKLFSNRHNMSDIKSANLYIKNSKSDTRIFVSQGQVTDNQEITFKFNIKDLFNNLYQGFFDLLVEYAFEDDSFSTQLYLLDSFNHDFSQKTHDYSIYRSGKRTLRIKSKRKWPSYEDTQEKRDKISQEEYASFRKLPINNKRVMFESLWAKQFNCNPRALYEFIDTNFPDYECIWSFDDEHKSISGKGIRVRKFSMEYYYYLATSKYLFDNVNFPDSYIKREGQIYVQTMHGTPLKTFGLDIPTEFVSEKSQEDFINRCNRWDYLIVQSDYTGSLAKRCFRYEGELLKVGYPRTDMLYSKDNPEDINKLKKKMGLPLDKKVILYAPTWRKRKNFDLMLDLKSFKESLSDDYVLILRMHHFAGNQFESLERDEFVFDLSRYESMEELYLVSDVLITDYSSAMFDYAILDRPIILFAYDMKEYINSIRGIYFDIEELNPGPVLKTSKEVEEAIINIDETEIRYKEARKKFQEKFNQYECENSTELVLNKVINPQDDDNFGIFKNLFSKMAYWFIKTF